MYLTSRRKRAFDVAGSFLGLVGFGPLGLAIAALIFLEERRGIFFVQERLGRCGRPFRILKFRTMTDGRVTRVGRWLRKTGLDELPQFVNVWRGELSVVGPRPLTAADMQRLGWSACDFRRQMTPGLTGLAQIRSGIGAGASLRADRDYHETATFRLDCKIIFISFLMNVFGKRAVQARLYRPEI